MKKIFSTFAMALVALTSMAQKNQQYFRVEFDVPVSNEGKTYSGSNTSVSATMKDNYVYCNPEHEYLDFQATDNPMFFRTTNPSNVSETSSFYIGNKRTTQSGMGTENYPYLLDHITKISAYSIPVEKITVDSTETYRLNEGDPRFPGDYPTSPSHKYYDVADFTFNRMPRNVAELKTLLEDENGKRVKACDNPLFMAAVCYFIWPRLLDCSQDCRDMWDYMYGKHYEALNTSGIANQTFQNACISQYVGKDAAGVYSHNKAFQHFGGATPSNHYKPNGKDYGPEGPFVVRVGWDVKDPLTYSGEKQCYVASMLLFPNPTTQDRGEIAFDYPVGHVVKFRSTKTSGWFLMDGEKSYYSKGKDQVNTDF